MIKMNELYEKVAASEELQKEFAEITKKATADNAEEIVKELIDFAKRQGYEVTAEEMKVFFSGMASDCNELSDMELDAVAGGKGDVCAGILVVTLSILSFGVVCLWDKV